MMSIHITLKAEKRNVRVKIQSGRADKSLKSLPGETPLQ